MKKLLYIPLIAGLLYIGLSCKKQECCSYGDCNFITNKEDLDSLYYMPSQYIARATKVVPCVGEMDWKANTYIRMKEKDLFDLGFGRYNDAIWLLPREAFSFFSVPFKLGRHFASKQRTTVDTTIFTIHSYRVTSDGDVLVGTWYANPHEDSWVQINKIDLEKREMEGAFELFLSVGKSAFTKTRSEYVNLRSGTFKAKF